MIFDSAASMANMVNMEALSQSLASMSTIRTYAEAAAEAATAVNVDKENQNPTQEWRPAHVGVRDTAGFQLTDVISYYVLVLFQYLSFLGNLIFRTIRDLWIFI